ncbi:MAG: endonuclease/exonuclease/phosphatase family protein [Actinomycetota bacterium]|nr:endonuclease/exonuclease/phosphatase family protein [Actinomycetota bacterium]
MKLLNWNVAGRTRRLDEQARAVLRQDPDVVCLQEIRESTLSRWTGFLHEVGLPGIAASDGRANRRLFNLTAARWPVTELPALPLPQPERLLSVRIEADFGPVEIHNIHVPPAPSQGMLKVETLEAVYAALAAPFDGHRILCGDFNTPRTEFRDGSLETFARNHPRDFERWDAAERLLPVGLAAWDLRDVFRQLNGYDRYDISWSTPGFHRRKGHRLDHILASRSLNAVWCDYQHGWRETGYSDHSAMEAIFEPVAIRKISGSS